MKINIRTVLISRSKRLALITAITFAFQAFVVSPSNSTLLYSITDLGALDEIFDGVTISTPSKVNNDGLVTGNSLVRNSVSFTDHAFQWNPTTGTMQDLGSLPGTSDVSFSADMNDAGQVVGESDHRAFLWEPTTSTMRDLGTLPVSTGNSTRATGINNLGEIVGWTTVSGGVQSFLWDPTTDAMRAIGPTGAASDINNQGEVVGNAGGTFVWDRDTNSTRFISLLPGGFNSDGKAINDLGFVTGNLEIGSNQRAAFLWDPNTDIMRDIGRLSGSISALGFDLNGANQVVGTSIDVQSGTATGSRAFVWSQNDGILDLNQLVDISGLFTDPVTFFNLTTATGINENGQIAALGWFTTANSNETLRHAFLLTPVVQPTITDTCDIGGGPNDIETVTASYDAATDEIVVEMSLCADADNTPAALGLRRMAALYQKRI